MQDSAPRSASNRRPILKSMSQTSVPQICPFYKFSIGVQFSNLCPFSNSQIGYPIFKSMVVSQFLKSTSNEVNDVCRKPYQKMHQRTENLERTPIKNTLKTDRDLR